MEILFGLWVGGTHNGGRCDFASGRELYVDRMSSHYDVDNRPLPLKKIDFYTFNVCSEL